MKVAIVAQQMRQPIPGGIGTYIRGLVGGLTANNNTTGNTTTTNKNTAQPIKQLSLSFVASRAGANDPLREWGHVPRALLGRRSTLLLWENGLLRAPEGHDVLHATSLAFPSQRPGSPTVATMFVHDVAWRTHPEVYPERGRNFHERALSRAIASKAALLVPSTSTADALLHAGVAASRLHIVGEGSDHLPLIGRSAHGEFLLAVSTLEPRKNLHRLVEAYARIRHRLPEPWPLYIVGPNGWNDRAGARPVDGSAKGVELLGPVSDARLAELLARARAFAYVPLAEGYGLPPAEAMRAGVPVVASAVPSVDPATARIVDPLDIDDIAQGLLDVSTDDALRIQLVAAGLARAATRTWKNAANAHRHVWEELLHRRAAVPQRQAKWAHQEMPPQRDGRT